MTDELRTTIDGLWLSFAPVARDRVDRLEAYVATLPDDTERAAAASAAHKLAGALGSYLRPGSEQAGELEDLLRSTGPVPADRAAALVRALRDAVQG